MTRRLDEHISASSKNLVLLRPSALLCASHQERIMTRLINHCKSNGATNAMMKRAVSYCGGETIISVGQQSELVLYARIPARAQQT
jgi:hypothetical protein